MNTYEISIRFDADSKDTAVELAEDVAPHLDGRALLSDSDVRRAGRVPDVPVGVHTA